MIAALASAITVSACGSGARQDASEPTGNFQVSASAHWITSQRLSQHSVLVIRVTNTGTKTIPSPAVTLTDTTPGEVNKLSLFRRLLTVGALPIITVLSTQFPAVSHFLFSWVQPTLEALR